MSILPHSFTLRAFGLPTNAGNMSCVVHTADIVHSYSAVDSLGLPLQLLAAVAHLDCPVTQATQVSYNSLKVQSIVHSLPAKHCCTGLWKG